MIANYVICFRLHLLSFLFKTQEHGEEGKIICIVRYKMAFIYLWPAHNWRLLQKLLILALCLKVILVSAEEK